MTYCQTCGESKDRHAGRTHEFEDRDMTDIRAMEKRIVRQFVKDTLAAGYRLGVSLERGYDTESMLFSADSKKIMDEAFAGDEAHLFIVPSDEPQIVDGQVNAVGWVYIVLGNDGYDVISDYSDNEITDELLADANALAESLDK